MSNNKNSSNKISKDSNSETKNDTDAKQSKEIGGREGPDPVRYGDWENNGIASDF